MVVVARKGFWVLTRDQMKDARALLRWSAQELADKAGIRRETVYRLESGALDLEKTALGIVRKLREALEAGGIEFLADGSVRKRQPVKAEKPAEKPAEESTDKLAEESGEKNEAEKPPEKKSKGLSPAVRIALGLPKGRGEGI